MSEVLRLFRLFVGFDRYMNVFESRLLGLKVPFVPVFQPT